jgi:murein tripeptide amidase MpaA
MNGIIKFLLDKKDYRAHLLRKYFVFVLVPMLNPDGVSNGHCRMDHLNQNLNRFYKTPDPIKQPQCYAVRKLCEHYQRDKRMFMYLDLHAHPAHKGNFMFGNAIYDFVEQV